MILVYVIVNLGYSVAFLGVGLPRLVTMIVVVAVMSSTSEKTENEVIGISSVERVN